MQAIKIGSRNWELPFGWPYRVANDERSKE